MTKNEFVANAINKLRQKDYKGIHVVYSGFNKAYKEYWGSDPQVDLKLMDEFVTIPCRGGAMLMHKADYKPKNGSSQSASVLEKILG